MKSFISLFFFFPFITKLSSVVIVRKNDYDYKWPMTVKVQAVMNMTMELLFQRVQSTKGHFLR